MGILLNPDCEKFKEAFDSKIYVDKSMLMKYTNDKLRTNQKYICVSRPRRFGKSITANMLSAYYGRGNDTREMFSNLKIAKCDSFERHLNQYNVIRIDMSKYISESKDINEILSFIEDDIIEEIEIEMKDVIFPKRRTLTRIFQSAFDQTKIPFIFIIDEWDCFFRENQNDKESHKIYLDFLRNILKDQSYVALAYMTGILPIKKYGIHSALNMFYEFSMTESRPLTEFIGFTEQEVLYLCQKYNRDFAVTKRWYNGYCVDGVAIYNPKSVVESIERNNFNNYWTLTESFEALNVYIRMNFDGLRDDIVKLLAGEKIIVDTTTFSNDMVTFNSKDDVLTLLIHLGYLTYNFSNKEVSIPNYEISQQFASSIKHMNWTGVSESLKLSNDLVNATFACNEEKVAEYLEQAHQENTSILKYNDENSLACVISLAYYSMRDRYVMHRELPTGKGYADIVFLPRVNVNLPAIVVELKRNKTAESAIEQIKNKNYTDKLAEYSGKMLLVGINYDDEKGHSCKIEKFIK